MSRFNNVCAIALVALAMHHHQKGIDAARILGMFPLQGKSHFVMGGTLMKALAERGHQVDVFSHFPLKNPPPNYRDFSLAGSLPNLVNNITLENAERFMIYSYRRLFDNTGRDVCNLLGTPKIRNIIENPPTDPPYDLVIYELFAADCYLALGRHLNVPIVGIETSKITDWMNEPLGNPSNLAFVPSALSGFTQRMSFIERLVNTLMSSFSKLNWLFSTPSQLALIEKHFGIKVSSMSELYKDIAIMLVNTHPSFDFVRPMTHGIVEVGGLHVTNDHQDLDPEIEKWLDDSKYGCVYFSFGSMVKIESFPDETIETFYEAFERIAPVRVLMKIANKNELLPGLPKNVMTSSWFAQSRVLQHKNVKAFVTHGGLMSTQEAITYGVPMIDFPIFADQYLNARLSKEKGFAIIQDYTKVTADSFTKALQDILTNSSYSENAKQFSKLWNDRPMKAIDTAIYWVEYVIRNGNLLKSPATDLSWWQTELLDVFAFLFLALVLTLYAAKQLVKLVTRQFHFAFKKKEDDEINKKYM